MHYSSLLFSYPSITLFFLLCYYRRCPTVHHRLFTPLSLLCPFRFFTLHPCLCLGLFHSVVASVQRHFFNQEDRYWYTDAHARRTKPKDFIDAPRYVQIAAVPLSASPYPFSCTSLNRHSQ